LRMISRLVCDGGIVMPTKRLTIREVAERLRCSTSSVLRLIASGQLRGINNSVKRHSKKPRYVVDEGDLAAFELTRASGAPAPPRWEEAEVKDSLAGFVVGGRWPESQPLEVFLERQFRDGGRGRSRLRVPDVAVEYLAERDVDARVEDVPRCAAGSAGWFFLGHKWHCTVSASHCNTARTVSLYMASHSVKDRIFKILLDKAYILVYSLGSGHDRTQPTETTMNVSKQLRSEGD
jgi:hypothetical protein